MTKDSLIVVVFIAAVLGCSKKSNPNERVTNVSNGGKLATEQGSHGIPETRDIREIAKSRLQPFDFDDPRALENNIETLRQLTRDLEIVERLSHAEALNELFIALTNSQPSEKPMFIKAVFDRAVLNDSEEIASLMGELPAGEFRRFCVASIWGRDLPTQQLEEIYQAMPESKDRSDVAERLVEKTFLENGIDPALAFVQSLTSPYERKHALDALVNSVSSVYQIGGKMISDEHLDKVKVYAKSIDQMYPVRVLDKLSSPDD